MIKACKFCKVFDKTENMHQDKHTGEHYHEACRPVTVIDKPVEIVYKGASRRGRPPKVKVLNA